jgi:hypothetical protein
LYGSIWLLSGIRLLSGIWSSFSPDRYPVDYYPVLSSIRQNSIRHIPNIYWWELSMLLKRLVLVRLWFSISISRRVLDASVRASSHHLRRSCGNLTLHSTLGMRPVGEVFISLCCSSLSSRILNLWLLSALKV